MTPKELNDQESPRRLNISETRPLNSASSQLVVNHFVCKVCSVDWLKHIYTFWTSSSDIRVNPSDWRALVAASNMSPTGTCPFFSISWYLLINLQNSYKGDWHLFIVYCITGGALTLGNWFVTDLLCHLQYLVLDILPHATLRDPWNSLLLVAGSLELFNSRTRRS